MRSNLCAFLAVLLSASAASMPAPTSAAVPTVYNLGTLGGTESYGIGINTSGQVAGSSQLAGNVTQHAFLYTGTPGSDGVIHDLGTLGGTISGGSAINDAGQVAGWSELVVDNVTRLHAFLYTGTPGSGGGMHDLGTLGGTESHGRGINKNGQVVGLSLTSNFTQHAFLYTGTPGSGGMMHDLGTLGGTHAEGMAINASGQVAGWSQLADNETSHAVLYTGMPGNGGVMHDLGTLGGRGSYAHAINESGQVVGFSDTAGFSQHAFLYTGTPGVDGKMIDLDAWLDATNPAEGAKWLLQGANGLTDSGLITGWGYFDDGPNGLSDGLRAFVLDASSLVVVPEPSSLALLTLAVAALLRRRRSGPRPTAQRCS